MSQKFKPVDHILAEYSTHTDIEEVATSLYEIQDIKGVEQLARTGLDRGWSPDDIENIKLALNLLTRPVRGAIDSFFLGIPYASWAIIRPSVEETLKHFSSRVKDGWSGQDILGFAQSISEGRSPKEAYLDVRAGRQVEDLETLRAFYDNEEVDVPIERLRFLRTRHPTLDKFCEDLGVEDGFEAHDQLAQQVRDAFGDVVYGSAEIIEEESRVFVARMQLEFADQTLSRGVVKLLEDPDVFQTEVNEYWYRVRLGLDDPGKFSAVPITIKGKERYYSMVMGHLGELNLANWLNILRKSNTPDLPEEHRRVLRRDRRNLMSTANRMIAKSHAYARKVSTTREQYLGRAKKFLEHTSVFLRMARSSGLLDVPAKRLTSDIRKVRRYVCPNIGQLADYMAEIPTVFYYDCVTKNFPLDPGEADGERTVRLPTISSRALETRVLLYTKYLGEEVDPSQSRTMPVKPFTVNSVDRCRVKREPGLFDLANFFLTSFFIRAPTPESEVEMVREVRELLWEYLIAFDQELASYNALVQHVATHPRQFIVDQIKLDTSTQFRYLLGRSVTRKTLAGCVENILGKILQETEAGQAAGVYFGKVRHYVTEQGMPRDVETYFRVLAKFVRGLKEKKNPYLENKGYTTSIPPEAAHLNPDRMQNDACVLERFKEIETDLYVSLPYRGAMIADTVPFYVSQDGELTPERINYYQIEVGNMLQSTRILRQAFVEPAKEGALRVPLEPKALLKIEKAFEILHGHIQNLRHGRIKGYEKLEDMYK